MPSENGAIKCRVCRQAVQILKNGNSYYTQCACSPADSKLGPFEEIQLLIHLGVDLACLRQVAIIQTPLSYLV